MKFLEKISILNEEIKSKIVELIEVHGVESEFNNEKVIKVKDEQMFNLDGDGYLVEISKDNLIDSSGYNYSYECLSLEMLAEIIDSFEN